MKQQSPEWFAARKGRVTGSIAGAILGLSPFHSRNDIMRMMVREYHDAPKEIEKFVVDTIFAYGNYFENDAIIDFQMETGLFISECGFYPYSDWLGASPDGLIGVSSGVEIKSPYSKRNDEKPVFKAAKEQPHYFAQMQIEMLCAKLLDIRFYQWAPRGTAYEVVYPDNVWLDENLPLLREFYNEYLQEIHNKEHLEPLRKIIDTPLAQKLLTEYDELLESEDNIRARKKDILKEFAVMSKDKNATICGRSFTLVSKQGSISYAKMVKKFIPEQSTDDFRGKSSEYWLLK